MRSTALLHSRSSGERPGATGIWVNGTLVQRPSGIELRRKCLKTECFEGKGTEALPQSFYCTLTALRRKLLIMNGAGEGNRTLVILTKVDSWENPTIQGREYGESPHFRPT
jgi:hypothetical protein